MAALTKQIVFECKERCGSLWEPHDFSFAAQGGEKLEDLPGALLTKNIYLAGGPLTGRATSKSHEVLHKLVKAKARKYMTSNPGPDNEGCNTDSHPRFYRLIEGAPFEFDELCRLNEILDYRQGLMRLAELYFYALEIGIPDHRQADRFDELKWHGSQLIEKNRDRTSTDPSKAASDLLRSETATTLLKRFDTIKGWVIDLFIFNSPLPRQGLCYTKPNAYLSSRLAESPMSIQQIRKKLEDLLQDKLEEAG